MSNCGSLGNQHNGGVVNRPFLSIKTPCRSKPAKVMKELDGVFHWICKFAGRKKVGMLLLCIVSAAVFCLVLYVGKGEDVQQGEHVPNIKINKTMPFISSNNKVSFLKRTFENVMLFPPAYFLGYALPSGHPCNSFISPPPPVDRKRTGPRPCPVCYLPVQEAIAYMPKFPSFSPVLKNLSYVSENPKSRDGEFGGSDFGGYPTLEWRNESYNIKESMTVYCGFVRGRRLGQDTGFDMDETDLFAMEQCNGIVVASAIFGAFDNIQQPRNISDFSKKSICFFMFVDQETEAYLKRNSGLDGRRKIGLWRIVVVHNLPYTDGRRNGKVPKLLAHRMFPNARFSLWIDGKLELLVDPYQILERHLWRKNATFAISRHYKRFNVFVEAEANKAAGKYDNASIDFQIEFYKKEGLTPYTEAKLPITSDVPEGCVVIKEHIPITNLFTCLWFNEVDRFTSRDQISFSTVRDKIQAKTNWTINMFLDCERRNFVVQKYHRDVLEHMPSPPLPVRSPPLPSAKMMIEADGERHTKKPCSRRCHKGSVHSNKDYNSR